MHGQQFGYSFDIGSIIPYECNKCYTMEGASTIRCNQYGMWTAAMSTCTRKSQDYLLFIFKTYGFILPLITFCKDCVAVLFTFKLYFGFTCIFIAQ